MPESAESANTKDDYWKGYYAAAKAAAAKRPLPSQFATFVAGELDGQCRILEFGCGGGRDSLFFSSHGHDVIGTDGAAPAVALCKEQAEKFDLDARFVHADIESAELLEIGRSDELRTVVYARFFLHAISEEEEKSFLAAAKAATRSGDLMAVEYRTIRDQAQSKVTDSHYRRFIEPPAFMSRAEGEGFVVDYSVEGFGYAKYKHDDAYVARCLLSRR
jgi:cyclopropane fatty-acyl-phospholipid synthase-like methyltransferase